MLLAIALLLAFQEQAQPTPVFGTTVVIPSGLRGDIYFLGHHPGAIPKVEKKRAKGTIYTTSLNVPPQDFKLGFPGVTDRLEWFAIDYTGKFYVSVPGVYRFQLTSDDGSELAVDSRKIIDNGGLHPPKIKEGEVCLATGIHDLRVLYFQGIKYLVALILEVAAPDQTKMQIFDTGSFKPPAGDPKEWPPSNPGPCAR
jgi:PA14 domain